MEAKYKCKQSELYEAVDLVLDNLTARLPFFVMKKAKYTAAYVTTVRAQKVAARVMLNDEQRKAIVTGARIQLKLYTATPLQMMHDLGSYIRTAWKDKDLQKARRQEAGMHRMDEVEANDWEELPDMMQMADSFITKYSVELLAGDNMPAGFGALVAAEVATADSAVSQFMALKNAMETNTASKVGANNALFDEVMTICLDGQDYYSTNEDERKLFVWDHVIETITPPGATGLKGDITDGVTFLFIGGGEVRLQKEGQPAIVIVVNEDGSYVSPNLEEGLYSVKVSAPGYVTLETTKEITTGTISRGDYTLMPE